MTQPGDVRVRRALLSVSDKRGVVDFARGLAGLGIELVSTGGTARELSEAGLEVRAIEDFTGFPEIMGGRVKTLHPKLYAGLLALRDDPAHMVAVEQHGVELVDLVCVNLYPFERTAGRRGATEHEAIENIDIGGPTMIRAAAKNFGFIAVVTRPESYDAVLQELIDADAKLSLGTRESLAAEAFSYTARYDAAIARWFLAEAGGLPDGADVGLREGDRPRLRREPASARRLLRPGRRAHARALERQAGGGQGPLVQQRARPQRRPPAGRGVQRPGLRDRQAQQSVRRRDRQLRPRGLRARARLRPAVGVRWRRLPQPPDRPRAGGAGRWSSSARCCSRPHYTEEALELLESKPNMRILEDNERRRFDIAERDLKRVMGGLLVQDRDIDLEDRSQMEVVTERKPTEAEWGEMLFGWKVCKHVRSNAIVLSRELATVGIGAGQMSRVDSVRLAVEKAGRTGLDLHGAAVASDAFFPFADGPRLAVEAGVTSIIQPGGSKRDMEVVEAADEAGISMIFTHRRHFKH